MTCDFYHTIDSTPVHPHHKKDANNANSFGNKTRIAYMFPVF
jgi:hypothetical protein